VAIKIESEMQFDGFGPVSAANRNALPAKRELNANAIDADSRSASDF